MSIKVNKIEPETCEVFDPNGKSLGHLNQYEFFDLCIQIMKAKAEGYYVLDNDRKVLINNRGRIGSGDIFMLFTNQLRELVGF